MEPFEGSFLFELLIAFPFFPRIAFAPLPPTHQMIDDAQLSSRPETFLFDNLFQ